MKKLVNRVLIVLDALITHFIRRKTYGKKVIILFQQIFGDAIIISDSLGAYNRVFPKSEGYDIHCLVRPSVLRFMKDTLPLPVEMNFEELDFNRYIKDFFYYKECNRRYKNEIDILIVPGTSLSAEIFAVANDAKRKIGLVRSVDLRKPIVMAYFAKHAYTERVRPEKESMMLQRHKLLLNYLGDENYQAKLPTLSPQKRIINEEHYCVMCPGSSKTEKCWPAERFAETADYIIEKYGMNIHLCGGADEVEFEKIILSNVKFPESVISHIGKTSFSDWSSIVQHADLVFGNDSATMHLAAASKRKAICIAGVYDKYQFFPYKVDLLEPGDRLPITLIKDMPCEWCRTLGYDSGYNNSDCKKRIRANKCSLCIELITVSDLKEQIIKLMEG